jgi:hypothetical protein
VSNEAAVREAFETYMSGDGRFPKAVERDGSGGYLLGTARTGWADWQAAWRAACEHCATLCETSPTLSYSEGVAAKPASERDTARLDWLERGENKVFRCEVERRRPLTDGRDPPWERYLEFSGWATSNDADREYPTARAAIDAAIDAAQSGR